MRKNMITVSVKKNHKSISPSEFTLSDFCVMTGRNGSGKSHLLEAIEQKFAEVHKSDGNLMDNIKYIRFNGLNPNIVPDCDSSQITKKPKEFWKKYQGLLNNAKRNMNNFQRNPEQLLIQHGLKGVNKSLVDSIIRIANKDYQTVTENDFIDYYNYSIDEQRASDIFSSQFASIFKAYQIRLDSNEYQLYRNSHHGEDKKVLSETEFAQIYGPKPWNLINTMMENAALPYRVNNPEGQNRDADFHLQLRDEERNINIQANDLSTGEKVLMSLALAIYNTREENNRPELLLLDEPDAGLHPEFSKVLVMSILDSIVDIAGVKVIMTTHNPSTVAIAPEGNIYKMDKDIGRPIQTNKQSAIAILTRGVDSLRVSAESRRQVFVESQYDVYYYEKLSTYIKFKSEIRPVFLAPCGNKQKERTTNCADVINIVSALTDLGNDLVYGLIDYDNETRKLNDKIKVMGTRYSIENYIFDPIYIGLMLLHNKIKNVVADANPQVYHYRNCGSLSNEQLQQLIDAIVIKLGFTPSEHSISYLTLSGNTFMVPEGFFLIKGHDLEEKMLLAWPELNSIKRSRSDNIMKKEFLEIVIDEYPEYLSTEIQETLNSFV